MGASHVRRCPSFLCNLLSGSVCISLWAEFRIALIHVHGVVRVRRAGPTRPAKGSSQEVCVHYGTAVTMLVVVQRRNKRIIILVDEKH